MRNEKDKIINRQLLDDDDFVALMDAEYCQYGGRNDDLRKQKTWSGIEHAIAGAESGQTEKLKKGFTAGDSKSVSVMSKSGNMAVSSVAVAAVLMIMVFPFSYFNNLTNGERMKGPVIDVAAKLDVFTLGVKGRLQRTPDKYVTGSTVVFKADVQQAEYSALVLSKNNREPEVRFMGEMKDSVRPVLLESKNRVYGYMLEPDDRKLRFCLLHAMSKPLLRRKLRALDEVWKSLPSESCVNLNVTE